MVSTKGLTKKAVLAALYNSARPFGLGILLYDPKPMTEEDAQEILDSSTSRYFDYLKGRLMKVDLSDDNEFDERLFDRDYGPGSAARVIHELYEDKSKL